MCVRVLCIIALALASEYREMNVTMSMTAIIATMNRGLFKAVYAPAESGTRLVKRVTVIAIPPKREKIELINESMLL